MWGKFSRGKAGWKLTRDSVGPAPEAAGSSALWSRATSLHQGGRAAKGREAKNTARPSNAPGTRLVCLSDDNPATAMDGRSRGVSGF